MAAELVEKERESERERCVPVVLGMRIAGSRRIQLVHAYIISVNF